MASRRQPTRRQELAPLQTAALLAGLAFLLLGILGFIPGITDNYDQMTLGSYRSEGLILSIFGTNFLLNLVYLGFGVVGLITARDSYEARYFLVLAGIVFVLLWAIGMLVDLESSINFLAVNEVSNWLHLVLGLGMLGANVLPAAPPEVARRAA